MGRLFGTDGVRGIANRHLTPELAFALGRAGALVLAGHNPAGRQILIGRDTRISGTMLEAAMAAGICSVGFDAVLAGVVPTPAVAYLVRHDPAITAGVVQPKPISSGINDFPESPSFLSKRSMIKAPRAM